MTETLTRGDALLLVDIQNDFCPGGALPVPDGDAVVAVANQWIDNARKANISVLASRDWHPREHCSFKPQGGPWPVHCVQDTEGVAFRADLNLTPEDVRISKGSAFDKDANSAFEDTGLASYLQRRSITHLYVGGLAEDVCVLQTVLDARRHQFNVTLITAATRAVDPTAKERVEQDMRDAGAVLI